MLERLPLQQLHGDERPAFGLVHVVNRADVGVIEGGSGLGFALETLERRVILCEFLRQKLQRDEAVELGVLGLIDHAHSAAAKLFKYPIMRERFVNHGSSTSRA